MNKSLPVAALLCSIAGGALAQSNVTIYGIVDVAVERVNHAAPGNSGLTRMPSITGSVPSRFGFRGVEDLGGGLKSFFVLESGFAPDSGALNYGGRLFGRQANVGLSNQYGALTLGRQYNMTFFALIDADILGPNIYAISNIDSYIANTRSDNAIGYLGKFGAFSVGATYSLGRDAGTTGGPQATNCPGEAAADSRACRQWTVMAKYDAPAFGISVSDDLLRGGPGGLLGLSSSAYSDTRRSLNGYFKAGALKVGGGVIHRVNTSAASFTSNLVYIGAAYPITPFLTLDGQFGRLDTNTDLNETSLLGLRATYYLSKRTATYISAGRMDNKGVAVFAVSPGNSTVAGATQSGLAAGIRHSF